MKAVKLGCLFLISLLFVPQLKSQPWHSGGVLSEIQQGFDVHFYDINLEIHPDEQFISGFVDVYVFALKDSVTVIELDLVNHYQVDSVTFMGAELGFEHGSDKLLITLQEMLQTDERVKLRVHYSGNPPVARRPPWDGGFNWSKDPDGNHWIGVSCQMEGGKLWLPVKDHPTSRADSISINITVPAPYFVASNGLLEQINEQDDKITYHWFTRYPIHNYNVSINIGLFEAYEKPYFTQDGSMMPVVFYVLPQYREHADEILDMTIEKLKQLRAYFGEFGFTSEKFGLVHTYYLGMEHQTINSYGNDFQYFTKDGKSYDWLLLHEMGHEWWGNLVTIRDWADFWIHEGITTFTDALFLWDFYSPELYHEKLAEYAPRISNRQPIIPWENATTRDVYNHDVYYKGAYFMHTLSYVLGRPTFLNIIRAFVDQNRYGYTSTAELRDFFERYSGMALSGLFELYLYGTDYPEVVIEQVGLQQYEVSIPNISFVLPMDIETSSGLNRINLSADPVMIQSESVPVADPENWYLKRVIHRKQ